MFALLNAVDHAKDHFTQTEKQRWHSTFCSYKESLVESSLIEFSDFRLELVDKLFKDLVQNKENKLHGLLPALNRDFKIQRRDGDKNVA